MPPKRELSVAMRAQIQVYHGLGWSQRKIAENVGCSLCGVQTTLKRFKETGSYETRKRSGRPRKTSARIDRDVVRSSLRNRRKTTVELAEELTSSSGISVSRRTVGRRLAEAGLKGRKARKKPWISETNRQKRLAWALKFRDKPKSFWERIVWSDEANIEVNHRFIPTFYENKENEYIFYAIIENYQFSVNTTKCNFFRFLERKAARTSGEE